MTMRRKLYAATVGVLCGLLLTGCLTSTARLEVGSNGSGFLRLEATPNIQTAGAIESTGAVRVVRNAVEGVDGATFEIRNVQGQSVFVITVPFEDYRELTSGASNGVVIGGARIAPFSSFDLREQPDGGWRLQARTNPLASAVDFGEGSPFGGLVDLAEGADGAGLDLSIKLPGSMIDSNADSREGGIARWKLSDPSRAYDLLLVTESKPLLNPLQWLLIALGVLFAVGAILMFVGASGPAKRRSLFPSSRRPESHEVFLNKGPSGSVGPPPPANKRARKRRGDSTANPTGWEPPPATTTDEASGGPAPGAGGPTPPRPLPHIDASGGGAPGSAAAEPDDPDDPA